MTPKIQSGSPPTKARIRRKTNKGRFMESNFTLGDRVSHPDYAGIGIVDEILPEGISVSWCEWDDAWHYMDQNFPLFTTGLQLAERAETTILEDAA